MDINNITGNSLKVIFPIFILFLIYVMIKILDFFALKSKNEHTRFILLKIESFVLAVVKEVEQTLVPVYTANGQILTKEGATQLKEAALTKVNRLLGEDNAQEAQKILNLATDQFQIFLSTQIEKHVYDVKKEGMARPEVKETGTSPSLVEQKSTTIKVENPPSNVTVITDNIISPL